MTEAELQERAAAWLRVHGWLVYHARPARTDERWRTPVQYDGAGFPDLVAARRGVVLLIECKTELGRVSPRQREWIAAGGVILLRPRGLGALAGLTGRHRGHEGGLAT